MWFIGVEVEQETSASPPKKNPGSAPVRVSLLPASFLAKYSIRKPSETLDEIFVI